MLRITKTKYVIGLLTGGLMEMPDFSFSGPIEVIEAHSRGEACEIYNKKHDCSYFYGAVMATVIGEVPINIHEAAKLSDIREAIREYKKNGK